MTATDLLPDVAPTTGIVWTYRFRPDGTAELIANEQVDAVLSDPGDGWVWCACASCWARAW